MSAASPPRRQCAHCPWKKSTVPERDIAGGYSEEMHRQLVSTISRPGEFRPTPMMACHESKPGEDGEEVPCVGWLHNQLGPGNNIALRLEVSIGNVDGNVRTVGPQHKRFEDTLPRGGR